MNGETSEGRATPAVDEEAPGLDLSDKTGETRAKLTANGDGPISARQEADARA